MAGNTAAAALILEGSMTYDILYLRVGDRQPYYRARAEDAEGNAIDLTDCTIACTMKSNTGTVKINGNSSNVVLLNQVSNKGVFEYRWGASDVDTSGTYYITFKVTTPEGETFTLPADVEAVVEVRV